LPSIAIYIHCHSTNCRQSPFTSTAIPQIAVNRHSHPLPFHKLKMLRVSLGFRSGENEF